MCRQPLVENIDINLPVKNSHEDNEDWWPYPQLSQPQPGFMRTYFIARSQLTQILSHVGYLINTEIEEDDVSANLQVVDLYEQLRAWEGGLPASLDLSINTKPHNLQLQYVFLTTATIQLYEY
jgi:hypothetical protein